MLAIPIRIKTNENEKPYGANKWIWEFKDPTWLLSRISNQ